MRLLSDFGVYMVLGDYIGVIAGLLKVYVVIECFWGLYRVGLALCRSY